MIQAYLTAILGGAFLIVVFLALWVSSKWHHWFPLEDMPFYPAPPPPEPDIINKPKTTGMVHIKFNKRMEFVVSIKAGNHETLQHSEGLQSKLAVKKHLAALAKATNSPGLAVKDHTGQFPELETA